MRNATETTLGELEREVLQLVWRHAPCAAETVREQLGRPLKESTIRTVLRRLEEKGLVTHTVDNRTFLYTASEAPRHTAARAVQGIIEWFCNGSVEEMLVGLTDLKVIDRRELKRLAEKIAQTKGSLK